MNSLLLALALLIAGSASAWAVMPAVPATTSETHRLDGGTTFQEIVEARCTICHSRERVDAAIRSQADLNALLQRMVERGALLSERDRKVLGTFWGSPIKGDAGNTPPAR